MPAAWRCCARPPRCARCWPPTPPPPLPPPPAAQRACPTPAHRTQVCAALQSLQLGGSNASSSSSGEQQGAASVPAAADAGADPAADDDAAALASFAGTARGRLGVSQTDLLREALPPEGARTAALQAALPALEAELQRRCRLVAAASGYCAEDHSGLPDHLRQLAAARSQASQVGQGAG